MRPCCGPPARPSSTSATSTRPPPSVPERRPYLVSSAARGAATADSGDTHVVGSGSMGQASTGAAMAWRALLGAVAPSAQPQCLSGTSHSSRSPRSSSRARVCLTPSARTAWSRWTTSQLTKTGGRKWIILLSTHLDKWEWNPTMNKNQL